MFCSRPGFSGSADQTALFRFDKIQDGGWPVCRSTWRLVLERGFRLSWVSAGLSFLDALFRFVMDGPSWSTVSFFPAYVTLHALFIELYRVLEFMRPQTSVSETRVGRRLTVKSFSWPARSGQTVCFNDERTGRTGLFRPIIAHEILPRDSCRLHLHISVPFGNDA